MSDFWPDFFSAGWTCWIKWAGKDVCGYKRVGGPVPGILGSATTTSTDPVKCECVATAHCVHPSIAHRCALGFAADVLTVEPPACSLPLPAYDFGGLPWVPRSCGRRGRLDDEESRGHTTIKALCPGDDHGGWLKRRQPFLV